MPEDAAAPARRLSRETGSSVFGTDAAGYHDARLGYPSDVYAAIERRRGLGGTMVEIGPGTGLATADILAQLQPDRLAAVEPDPALARHLGATIGDPRLTVVNAPFVDAQLTSPIDLACAAASFHWLDPDTAFARLRVLLRPGGTVALWWNVYRQVGAGDPFANAVTPLLGGIDLPPSEGASGHYSLDVDHHRAALAAAGFVDFAPHLFRRERTLTAAQVRALYASYSYVRALPPARRDALLDAIERLAVEDFDDNVPNVVLTPLYLADAPDA